MKKPRIGITMRLESPTRRFYLGRDYSKALQSLGAVPVHIALIPDRDFIRETVNDLDGILLPGSDTDVDPIHFGEEPAPRLKTIIYEKEKTDFLVLEEAEKNALPVFGICFGMQIMNVFRGGSLIQDIETQIPGALKHEQGIPLARASHKIEISPETKLAEIAETIDARVNSHHHQSIKNVGENLNVSARAKDGVIEGIEEKNRNRFFLGVQWHPELSWRTDSFSRKLFETFIGNCK